MLRKSNKQNNSLALSDAGYFRPCQPSERLCDVAKEARSHGAVVAIKGAVTCIMPKLVEGWQLVGAR